MNGYLGWGAVRKLWVMMSIVATILEVRAYVKIHPLGIFHMHGLLCINYDSMWPF